MSQIGLFLPTAAPDAQPDTVLAHGLRAEAAGLHSVWTLDRLVFNNHEPLISLAALAGATKRVELGTGVLLGALRPPALLAKMVATIDQLSGGRMNLGLGVGSRADDFLGAGVPVDGRGPRLAELIRILRLAWSGAPVHFEGQRYQIDVGPIGPRPAREGGPPIWLGGTAEAQLRRAGRLADGYIGTSSGGPAGVQTHWQTVRRHAEAAGRDPDRLQLACLVFASVDEDRARAVQRARAYAEGYYPPGRNQVNEDALIIGSPEACRQRVAEYFAAGVQTLIVGPVTADVGHLDRLLGEVLTRV